VVGVAALLGFRKRFDSAPRSWVWAVLSGLSLTAAPKVISHLYFAFALPLAFIIAKEAIERAKANSRWLRRVAGVFLGLAVIYVPSQAEYFYVRGSVLGEAILPLVPMFLPILSAIFLLTRKVKQGDSVVVVPPTVVVAKNDVGSEKLKPALS